MIGMRSGLRVAEGVTKGEKKRSLEKDKNSQEAVLSAVIRGWWKLAVGY